MQDDIAIPPIPKGFRENYSSYLALQMMPFYNTKKAEICIILVFIIFMISSPIPESKWTKSLITPFLASASNFPVSEWLKFDGLHLSLIDTCQAVTRTSWNFQIYWAYTPQSVLVKCHWSTFSETSASPPE